MEITTMRRRVLLLALLTGLIAAISQPAGWSASRQGGGDAHLTFDATQTSGTARHNRADIAFLTNMIGHHREAVQMAELAATRAQHRELKRLARGIITAQTREITTMTRWLRAWGQPIPRAHGRHHADMMKLERARGATFDRMFLTMMIGHHREAVAMANTELARGVNPGAKRLARGIITAQTHEITTMTRWLRTWNFGATLPSTR